MAVIGIGATSRVSAADILALVAAAKARLDRMPGGEQDNGLWILTSLASLDRPATNAVFAEAALLTRLDLRLLTLDALEAAAPGCVTHSEKSMKHYGIPSMAEAAALAAAGNGARLLIPRFCGRNTTASVAARP